MSSTNGLGYGTFQTAAGTKLAHRVSWALAFGDIAAGLCVCHHCDTPACVRPDHLFLGTTGDNTRDMVRKRRHHAWTKPESIPAGDSHWVKRTPEKIQRGERSKVAKLNNDLVLKIRALAETRSQASIAREFGVSKATVCLVVNRKAWAHV